MTSPVEGYYKASGIDRNGDKFVKCGDLAFIRTLPMLRGKVWFVKNGVRRLVWQLKS